MRWQQLCHRVVCAAMEQRLTVWMKSNPVRGVKLFRENILSHEEANYMDTKQFHKALQKAVS